MADAFAPLDASGYAARDAHVVAWSSNPRAHSAAAKKYEVTPTSTALPTAVKSASKSTSTSAQRRHQRQLVPKKLLHFVHRFVVCLVALGYVGITFGASFTAMTLLRGQRNNPWNAPEDEFFPTIQSHLGTQTIRESPLVTGFLNDSTSPHDGAVIYLDDPVLASFSPCAGFTESQNQVFESGYLWSLFESIAEGTSYHIPELSPQEMELIAPVVDCHSTAVDDDVVTSGKFFFLVRQRLNPNNVSVLVMYLSVQQYEIQSQNENGAAAVATLQLIHDMRANDLDKHVHYIVSLAYPFHKLAFRVYDFEGFDGDGVLLMRVLPPPGSRLPPHALQTACREGFYLKGESEQSNVNNYHWTIESDAALAVSRWRWQSKSVLHDSWAWVHAVQFFIGMGLLSNLVILCLATYRNFMAGKPWIGDAFVAISTSQLVNGTAVLVSWYVNEWWSLREFCYSTVYHVAEYNNVRVHDMHMRADLLTLYLSVCGLIGVVFRERVDPLVAVVSFLIGYDLRIVMLKHGSVSIRDSLLSFVDDFYMENVSPRVAGQDNVTPLSFWTTHELGMIHYSVYARALLPIYATLTIPLGYVLLRKVYRYFVPDKVHVQRNTTGTAVSENEQSLLTQKRVLTLFEIATGAALESRFGVVAEFNTCVFIKGTKYASADGIYSTGFVIANKKYLLQTSDYWSIVLMKILRKRFRNIYVYDVNGSTVQQTARLVYPHTLSVHDLLNINVNPLS